MGNTRAGTAGQAGAGTAGQAGAGTAGQVDQAAGSKKVAVLGASGYPGAELLRLLAGHPRFEVVTATARSHEGKAVADVYPSLAAAYPDLAFGPTEASAAEGADLAFCALPHGASQALVPELLGRVGHVVDLAADFRLKDPGLYPVWYGGPHTCPELLQEAVLACPSSWARSGLRCWVPGWWLCPGAT